MTRLNLFQTFDSEAATQTFGQNLSRILAAGDVILLSGNLGAGKSTLARAVIRSALGQADAEVPSPTFTLVQPYSLPDFEIWHCDLYRLADPQELIELGLDAAFETEVCLIEWPDRLGDLSPDDPLEIHLDAGTEGHSAQITGSARWAQRWDLGDV